MKTYRTSLLAFCALMTGAMSITPLFAEDQLSLRYWRPTIEFDLLPDNDDVNGIYAYYDANYSRYDYTLGIGLFDYDVSKTWEAQLTTFIDIGNGVSASLGFHGYKFEDFDPDIGPGVGLGYGYPLAEKLIVSASGSAIYLFSLDSQLDNDIRFIADAGAVYQATEPVKGRLGYRYLTLADAASDLAIHGPYLEMGFSF